MSNTDKPTTRFPIQNLICCVCGVTTRGRQWRNLDTGHGLCRSCGDELQRRESESELFTRIYGFRGIYWDVDRDTTSTLRMIARDLRIEHELHPYALFLEEAANEFEDFLNAQ
jgi:hypothetical protein